MSFHAMSLLAGGLAFVTESPPNLDEPRLKVMPGFPRDGDLPKPVVRVLGPLELVLPLARYWWVVASPLGPKTLADTKEPTWNHYLGLALIGAGHLLMRWTQQHCGRFYTFDRSIKKEHKLITTGPYEYVQNPGYVALILTVLGVCTFSECSWLNLLPVGMTGAILSGLPVEEKMLRDEFGQEYDKFQATRYRLIPGVF